jgi:lysophospholipid acyltransferase (LPLAT)-like uncharacterized protein
VKKATKEKLTAWAGATFLRVLSATLRAHFVDECDFLTGRHPEPYVFALWHNRLLSSPVIFKRFFRKRKGVTALISQSRDGKMISDIILRLGMGVVNGSSSRGGAAAMLELTNWIRGGTDIAITPDGPRGPVYKLSSGPLFLAQKTGAPLVPVYVEYSRCIRFKSWDRFMVPLPFSRVDIRFGKMHPIPPDLTPEEFEAKRAEFETTMQPVTL